MVRVFFFFILLTVFAASRGVTGFYSNNKDVDNFINYMHKYYHFKKSYLIKLFSKANKPRKHKVPRIYRKRAKGIAKELRADGYTYHEMLYLNEDRVRRGVKFVNRYKTFLEKAQKRFKVDKYVIAAIIGIETYYGEIKGEWEVFNVLAYNAFKKRNKRTKLYRYELAKFLLFTRAQKLKPLYIKGSYCGALGLGQLMPHSYLEYGVNFDNSKRLEPFSNIDSIATVANYLHKKGWKNRDFFVKGYKDIYNKRKIYRNFKVLKKYNNSDSYAYCVLRLATILKSRHIAMSKRKLLIAKK